MIITTTIIMPMTMGKGLRWCSDDADAYAAAVLPSQPGNTPSIKTRMTMIVRTEIDKIPQRTRGATAPAAFLAVSVTFPVYVTAASVIAVATASAARSIMMTIVSDRSTTVTIVSDIIIIIIVASASASLSPSPAITIAIAFAIVVIVIVTIAIFLHNITGATTNIVKKKKKKQIAVLLQLLSVRAVTSLLSLRCTPIKRPALNLQHCKSMCRVL